MVPDRCWTDKVWLLLLLLLKSMVQLAKRLSAGGGNSGSSPAAAKHVPPTCGDGQHRVTHHVTGQKNARVTHTVIGERLANHWRLHTRQTCNLESSKQVYKSSSDGITGSSSSSASGLCPDSESPMGPRHLLSQLSVGSESGKDVPATLGTLGYVEEDRPLLPGLDIRAASMYKLAQLTCHCFDSDGKLVERTELPRVLLLMHQWVISSEQFALILVNLYCNCDSQVNCTVESCVHTSSCTECEKQRYKASICHLIRYWISNFPMHFDMDAKLSQTVNKFQDMIRRNGENSALGELIDISKVPSYDWMRAMSVRNAVIRHSSRRVQLVFDKLQPNELAEQLTFLEYKAFRRIQFSDFKHYAIHASLKENPKLERSIALFNGLSQWIQCMVLSKTTPQQRADIIQKFVDVAKRLRELQNFNTLMAVVGGLAHSSLARLNKTNTCIPSETQKLLMEFTELLSSSNNFSNYRKVLQQCSGFRIPILGVHLKDLISLNTALNDRLGEGGTLVNFRKIVQLSVIFTELMTLQNMPLPFEHNMDLVNTIRLSLDLHYTEDEIYELSLAREPRNSLSSPSTPTKPVVFADWVAGVSPPDPDTINKHVHDMVEAVFKNYDHDRDGFISHAEFEAIAGNFPFIDSFCVLDADQDGMISKAEMKTYFIRANCHALRKCFKHDFHEITYFKPTFCIHCTGLLWGLIKQGWKCKECSINAHKHCKDLVVMECRSKAHAACAGRTVSLPNGAGVHRDVTLASKRKMSQRQKRSRLSKYTQTDSAPSSASSSPVVTSRAGSTRQGRLGDAEYMANGSVDLQDATEDALFDKLQQTEKQARDKLLAENIQLRTKLETQSDQISSLRGRIRLFKQHTLTFIMHQMDTLHMQRDTEV